MKARARSETVLLLHMVPGINNIESDLRESLMYISGSFKGGLIRGGIITVHNDAVRSYKTLVVSVGLDCPPSVVLPVPELTGNMVEAGRFPQVLKT